MEEESQSKPPSVILPEDIIFDQILIRLSIKPLLRFKCVSKLWGSTISSPQFAKSHLRKSSSPYQFLLYWGNRASQHQFTSVTFDEHGRVKDMVNLNPPNHNDGPINVIGSCNGLVCFCDNRFNFYVWNPVTRQCNDDIIVSLSTPDYHPKNVISLGFVYVSSVDDYKIACLLGTEPLVEERSGLPVSYYIRSVYVFSFRSNSWDELTITNSDVDGIAISRADVPVLINETAYWSAKNTNVIVGVNLVTRQLSKMSVILTNMHRSFEPHWVKLFRMRGRLSLCCGDEVWMLKRDGVSWMLLYNLTLEGLRLLSITDDGKCLVHYSSQSATEHRQLTNEVRQRMFVTEHRRLQFATEQENRQHLVLASELEQRRLMLLDPGQMFLRQFNGGVNFGGRIFEAWDYKMTLVSPN